MNWCSAPRTGKAPGITLDLPCCGARDGWGGGVTIDVPEMPQEKLVISSESRVQYGSVTIDRNGLRRAFKEEEGGAAAAGGPGTGMEGNSFWDARLNQPRNWDQVNGSAAGSGAGRGGAGGGGGGDAAMRDSAGNMMDVEYSGAAGNSMIGLAHKRQSRGDLERARYSASLAKKRSTNPFLSMGIGGIGEMLGLMEKEESGKREKVALDDLVKIKGVSECLGKGVSGTVWKVVDKTVQEVLALKEMELEEDPQKCKLIVQEMQMMLDIDHPNVIACHGVFYERSKFQIVMEYMDAGSLYDILKLSTNGTRKHALPEDAIQGIAKQVLLALKYLHTTHRVIHRDLKPGNILLDRSGDVKLADFGVASRPRDSRDSRCATWVGTVTYMSPERIMGNDYSFNSDVWALGVIVVECALGHYPYLVDELGGGKKKKMEFWDLLDTVTNTESAHTRLPPESSDGIRSFAEYVLQKPDDTRPSSTQALSFPWVAGCSGNARAKIAECIHHTRQDRRAKDASAVASAIKSMSLRDGVGPIQGGVI